MAEELVTDILRLIASYVSKYPDFNLAIAEYVLIKGWVAHTVTAFAGEIEEAHGFLDNLLPILHSVIDGLSPQMKILNEAN